MNINDYIIEFEKRNSKLKEHSIELPDAVLAYRLLEYNIQVLTIEMTGRKP